MITITKNGKPLDKSLYDWNEKTKVFSSLENGLTISTELDGCTFKTGHRCTFTTGEECTFTTGSCCTFTTGSDCTFTTGDGCTFDTGGSCTFKTGDGCVVVRRDVFEVILLEEGQEIKLNDIGEMGFTVVEDEKEQKKESVNS